MAELMDFHVAIVGASMGGLSIANLLHRLGLVVTVFECFPRGFHDRGGALGGVDTELVKEIRGDKNGVGHHYLKGHGHFYGDVWRYLYEGIPEESVHFGCDVVEVLNINSTKPALKLIHNQNSDVHEILEFDMIIGADGGKSTIRKSVTTGEPKYSGYTLWRGLISTRSISRPPSGTSFVNGTYYATLGYPVDSPRGKLWNCGVYMGMPERMVEAPTRNRQVKSEFETIPEWFVPFVTRFLGEYNGQFWNKCCKEGKVSPHAVWEFAADQVVNNRIVLLGDAAHMATPRTGAGAYTAMLDAKLLGSLLESHFRNNSADDVSLEQVLRVYNEETVRRGKALYRQSRQHASDFAPDDWEPISPEEVLQMYTK